MTRSTQGPVAGVRRLLSLSLVAAVLGAVGCSSAGSMAADAPAPVPRAQIPSPDPRIGLEPGLFDAEQAIWNLELLSSTPPPEEFLGVTNSDLAFSGNYVLQGNYNGVQIWDISDPRAPELVTGYVCPASQSDVSVSGDLLFVSGEGLGGRIDCGTQGVQSAVSNERLRGIRIFDISDIRNPEYIANVQTCRGSHTHTVLEHPRDPDNVYVYVSGSAPVRPAAELVGCSGASPEEDPNTALFRIEVIQVPRNNPTEARIVSSPRIFEGLVAPPTHGLAPEDLAALERERERGAFIIEFQGQYQPLPDQFARMMLDSIVRERGGSGHTAADSQALREFLPILVQRIVGPQTEGPQPGPTQCHDITVYPAIGLAGGACEGYGLLLDISDPANPRRLSAVSDSNFAYWHSATFNNDGTAIMFTDEWGGGGGPKCRATDPPEWGANAIFTIENRRDMRFQTYFKIPAPQTSLENCVAHNGSLIPIPGRDVMVQGWYQGGITVIDWTDPTDPYEIAFHDRGPVNANQMRSAGSWSVYYYNGLIVSSEIARGLDIFALTPSASLTQNEIDAANTVVLDQLNSQGQPRFVWPPTFALARAYTDQLERSRGLPAARLAAVRNSLAAAERASGASRRQALNALAAELQDDVGGSPDAAKVRMLVDTVRRLAN